MALLPVGQIVDTTFDHYRKHAKPLLGIALWTVPATLPWLLGRLLAPSLTELAAQNPMTPLEIIGLVLMGLGSVVLIVVSIWIGIALISSVHNQRQGGRGEVAEVARPSWKLFFPALWILLLTGIVFACALLLSVPGIALEFFVSGASTAGVLETFASALTIIGVIATGVVLIALTVDFSFTRFLLVCDNVRGIAALKASRHLVSGRWWATLGRLLFVGILFSLLIFVAQFILVLLSGLLFSLLALTRIDALVTLGGILTALVSASVGAMGLPFLIISSYLIFDTLKKNSVEHPLPVETPHV